VNHKLAIRFDSDPRHVAERPESDGRDVMRFARIAGPESASQQKNSTKQQLKRLTR